MVDSRKPSNARNRPSGQGAKPGKGAQQDKGGQGKGGQQGRQASASGKLARGAAARRQAERERRRRTISYTVGVTVLVVALVGFIAWSGRDQGGTPKPFKVKPPVSTLAGQAQQPSTPALATAQQAAQCGNVLMYPSAGRNHLTGSQQPSNWNSNPPTSGDHYFTPLPAGVYTSEQDERALVHDLEHGYVVIQYKGIPSDQLQQLTKLAQGYQGQKVILAPWSGLPAKGVFTAAWQLNQACQQFDQSVVQAFIADYMVPAGKKSLAPEPGAA